MENLDLKIYQAIKAEANNYFNQVSAFLDEGIYTPKQLTEQLSLKAEKLGYIEVTHTHTIRLDVRKYGTQPFIKSVSNGYDENRRNISIVTAYNSGKQITIEIDNFKATFDACKVFDYLEKYIKSFGIKDKPTFTKAVETVATSEQPEAKITFNIEITKDHLTLSKYITKDELRPVMNMIYVSLDYYSLVASNGYVMGEKPARITNLRGEQSEQSLQNIFLNPEHLKNCIGICKVEYFGNKTIITNNSGEQYTTLDLGNYPRHKTVIPKVVSQPIEPVKSEEIKKFVTSCKKLKTGCLSFTMKGQKGESKLQLIYKDLDYKIEQSVFVELKNELQISFAVGYSIEQFSKLEKFNSFYLSSFDKATIFDGKSHSLLMTYMIEEPIFESEPEYIEHPFQTSCYKPAEIKTEQVEQVLQDAPEQIISEPISTEKRIVEIIVNPEIAEQLIVEHIIETSYIKEAQKASVCEPFKAQNIKTESVFNPEPKTLISSPETANNPIQNVEVNHCSITRTKLSYSRLFRKRKRKTRLHYISVLKIPDIRLKIAELPTRKPVIQNTPIWSNKPVLANNNSPPELLLSLGNDYLFIKT